MIRCSNSNLGRCYMYNSGKKPDHHGLEQHCSTASKILGTLFGGICFPSLPQVTLSSGGCIHWWVSGNGQLVDGGGRLAPPMSWPWAETVERVEPLEAPPGLRCLRSSWPGSAMGATAARAGYGGMNTRHWDGGSSTPKTPSEEKVETS